MVRDLIGEVVGMSPYEKRLLDMLKTGGVSAEKRMYKFSKRRVSLLLCLTRSCFYTYD
jgi:large subunit ribosomal protein L36e